MNETFRLTPSSDEGRWGEEFTARERAAARRGARMNRARWRGRLARHRRDLPVYAAVLAFAAAALIAMDFPTWVFFIPVAAYLVTLCVLRVNN